MLKASLKFSELCGTFEVPVLPSACVALPAILAQETGLELCFLCFSTVWYVRWSTRRSFWWWRRCRGSARPMLPSVCPTVLIRQRLYWRWWRLWCWGNRRLRCDLDICWHVRTSMGASSSCDGSLDLCSLTPAESARIPGLRPESS